MEALEDRTVPTYFTWNGGYANNNFDDARNWYQGGTGPLPAAGDSLNFVDDPVTGGANPCNNLHAATGGSYYSITVNFSSTVTLSTAITTETFNMQKGNTSQDANGEDINVYVSFGWTAGNINTSSYSGNLILYRRIPYVWSATIAPSGGTVHTGNTIIFQNGATGTFNPGTVSFTGGNGLEINANSGVEFAADDGGIVLSKTNAGQDATKVWIKTDGWATVGSKDKHSAILSQLALLNEGGTFTVNNGAIASFSGSIGPAGQAAAIRQTSGTIVIENGSRLWGDAYLAGGKLSTAARTTPGEQSFVAWVGAEDDRLTIDGATVEIGDPAYDKLGTGHTFSTLASDGDIVWKSGAARLSVGWKANGGPQESDLWNTSGTFTITGGANGAKLGPRPPVNVGNNTLAGKSWWILYGAKGTTVDVNPQKLNFEIAAQDNDWANEKAQNEGIDQLKLSHK